MSRMFSAKLTINSYAPIDSTSWDLYATVIDNTGNYFATNAEIGDAIYIDGTVFGLSILKYTITNIDMDKTSGTDLYATIKWDMGSIDPIDPSSGLAGIIGAVTDRLHISVSPSITIDLLDESFMTAVRNYENANIIDTLAQNNSPVLEGTPQVPTANIDSNDHEIANTEWVNKKIDSVDGIRQYTALENIAAYKIVYLTNDDHVGLANSDNIDQADCVVGMSIESKSKDEQISVILFGEVKNEAWGITQTGKKVFVGKNGDIELNPLNIAGFMQQIGITSDDNIIILNIQEAIILS